MACQKRIKTFTGDDTSITDETFINHDSANTQFIDISTFIVLCVSNGRF